jgi:hypothetical protein
LAETEVITLSEQYQISTYITLPKVDSKTPVPSDESVAATVATLGKAVSSGNFNRNFSEALVAQIGKVSASLSEIRQSEATTQATILKIDADLGQFSVIAERLTDY